MPTAIVDTQTSEFVSEGHEPDGRYVVVTLPRNPDPVREKWDGSAIVAKAAQEVTATLAAAKDADAAQAFDLMKALRAVALSNLAARLNVNPSALTPQQINAERARILAIYKAL